MRYTWSALLLIAAVLSPNVATTVTLLIAGVLTILLAVSREKRLAHLVAELSDLLAIQRKTSSVAMERSLSALQNNMLVLAAIGEAVIFICLLAGRLDITVARNYALLILVALAPLGLELELLALLRTKQKHGSETIRTALGYATEDARSLLLVIGLSFIGTIWLHFPPALSALQILFITCVARPLLSGRALQAMPHKVEQPWRVALTSSIVYGSFIFFFIQHYLEPRYADATHEIVWQAQTVAMLTFIGCQAVLLYLRPKLPTAALWRGGLLLIAVLSICYIAPLQDYICTHGPSPADWIAVIVASLSFAALLRLKQRFL